MNLVSWNCRGLGGNQKVEAIKRFKFSEKISILTIQETKLQEEDSLVVIKKFWKNGKCKVVSAQGASGGMLIGWDKNLFKFKSAIENHHCLFVELECLKTQEIYWIGNVYGPTIHGAKEEFWTQLKQQRHRKMQLP